MRELTLKTAALLEELGHQVSEIDNPVPARFKDDFLMYWTFLAFAVVRGGRRMFGPSFDRAKLDNLTLGLDRLAARNLPRIPLAIRRLSASRRVTQKSAATYDVVLMPTLAEVTPRIGHLDPTADYDQVMDRLLDWVAFTPHTEIAREYTAAHLRCPDCARKRPQSGDRELGRAHVHDPRSRSPRGLPGLVLRRHGHPSP